MVGVDEVGRGSWAGPLLVVAARLIGPLPEGLRDSKLMTREEREKMFNMLAPFQNLSGAVGNRIAEHQVFGAGLSNCCEFGEGWVKSSEIDGLGLSKGMKLGVARALRNLAVEIDEEIIMDGKFSYIPKKFINTKTLIDADNTVPLVSAASIYAKVTRDNFMAHLHKKYPAYNFASHVGYGTKQHQNALRLYGPVKNVHRFSYAPVGGLA